MKLIASLITSALVMISCASPEADPAELPPELQPYTEAGRRTTLNIPLPEISESKLTGGTLSSTAFDGKLTIVNFWATWCGPCIIEIPEFVALYEEWEDRPFEIVGVSMDPEGFELVKPFAEEMQINYPIILDEGELAEEFGGVYALPTTFLVDASGTIVYRFIGLFPMEEMKTSMEELLKQAEAT